MICWSNVNKSEWNMPKIVKAYWLLHQFPRWKSARSVWAPHDRGRGSVLQWSEERPIVPVAVPNPRMRTMTDFFNCLQLVFLVCRVCLCTFSQSTCWWYNMKSTASLKTVSAHSWPVSRQSTMNLIATVYIQLKHLGIHSRIVKV